MRFAGICGFVTHAGVALVAGAAAIGGRAATACARGTRFTCRAELSVVAGEPFVGRLCFAGVGRFVTHAGVALVACAAAIGGRPAAASARGTRFAGCAELNVVAGEPLVGRLRFTGVGRFVTHPGIALVTRAAAIGGRSSATSARRTCFARGAELAVIATGTVKYGLRFAGVGGLIAYAGVTLIAGAAAINRRSSAASARGARFASRAELSVVAGKSFVGRLPLAGVRRLIANTRIALITRAAAIRSRSAAATTGRASLACIAEQPVVACRTIEYGLRVAGIRRLVTDTSVALVACAAAIGWRSAAAHADRTSLARGAEQDVVAGEPFVGGLWFAGVGGLIADAVVALIARAAAIGRCPAAAYTDRACLANRAEQAVIAA